MAARNPASLVEVAAYTTRQAARIARLDYGSLNYMLRSGFIPASVQKAGGRGTWRLLSFADVAAFRVARELRERGFSLQALRKAVAYLRDAYGLRHPLAEARLITDGRDVFKVAHGTREATSVLRKPGQRAFYTVVAVGELWQEARREAARVLLEQEEAPTKATARVRSIREQKTA